MYLLDKDCRLDGRFDDLDIDKPSWVSEYMRMNRILILPRSAFLVFICFGISLMVA